MDELLGRKAPYSAAAEQAVIGSMLIDIRCIPAVLEKLRPDELYLQANRDIYETMYNMFSYGQTIDPVTVLNRMKVDGLYKEEYDSYLAEVMRVTPTAANVSEYVAIIKDRALLRRLGESADEINDMVYDGSGEADAVLEAAERKIFALRQGRGVGGLIKVSNVIQNVFEILEESAKSGSKIPGISTGLVDLDRKILGLNKSELIIIAARPGMGKTSIALNIGQYIGVEMKKTVAIFSLEMSREQLVVRFLSNAAGVSSNSLNTGQLSSDQWKKIAVAAQKLSEANILIDDNPTLTVSEMNAQCRRVQNLDLVIIDYLQLMQSSGSGHNWSGESRTQAVSDISRMLKVMAKELGVPVICLSQLSRANEGRSDKRPMLSDLRESGSIEQDADVVIGLYRDGYYNHESERPNVAEAIILKNRKGEQGTVELLWVPETTSFHNYDGKQEDD